MWIQLVGSLKWSLDTYIENGMNQDQFIGGFQEAISKITI